MNIDFFPGKTISTTLTGYITNLSPIKYKESTYKIVLISNYLRKKSRNELCASHPKHKLLKIIKQKNNGYKIKHFKRVGTK